MKNFNICVVLCVCLMVMQMSFAKPTIYKVNENDKLEPVLIPVSSTVIPLPVYTVEFGISLSGGKGTKPVKPDEPVKLITASKKKASTDQTNIKQISKDEFEKQ